MVKLTSKERDILDLLQDENFIPIGVIYKQKSIDSLLRKGYILRRMVEGAHYYKLNMDGK